MRRLRDEPDTLSLVKLATAHRPPSDTTIDRTSRRQRRIRSSHFTIAFVQYHRSFVFAAAAAPWRCQWRWRLVLEARAAAAAAAAFGALTAGGGGARESPSLGKKMPAAPGRPSRQVGIG